MPLLSTQLSNLILSGLSLAQKDGVLPSFESPEHIHLTRPKRREWGDYSSALPLQLANRVGYSPIDIANHIQDYLPKSPINYSGKKAKNAQEAHEAIRPTEISRTPEYLNKFLSSDQLKLYNLIWSRALSSQMESAKFDRKTITISSLDEKNIFQSPYTFEIKSLLIS